MSSVIEDTCLIYGRHNSASPKASKTDAMTRSAVSPKICQSRFQRLLPNTFLTPISLERLLAWIVDRSTKLIQAITNINRAIRARVKRVDLFLNIGYGLYQFCESVNSPGSNPLQRNWSKKSVGQQPLESAL